MDSVTQNFLFRHPSIFASAIFGQAALTRNLIRHEVSLMRKIWTRSANKDIEEVISEMTHADIYHTSGWLYALCRQFRPEVVLETGVRAGASTSFILQALEDNNTGRLYSIDLPNSVYKLEGGTTERVWTDQMPKGVSSGFGVPNSLKNRWTLFLGDARTELPKFLRSQSKIDLFFHDSEHTYDHMMFEMENAFQNLKEGGILAIDDVNWNSAFSNFCKSHKIAAFSAGNGGFAFNDVRRTSLPEIISVPKTNF